MLHFFTGFVLCWVFVVQGQLTNFKEDESLVPVNGAWSSWRPFNECSVSCGGGVQQVVRSCTNPEPQNGGEECFGPVIKTSACNNNPCPVDGGWSTWGEFGKCPRTCGGGTQRRSRYCNNPPPVGTGKQCNGSNVEHKSCNESPCPVDGNWSEWGNFTECSKTCGGGFRGRVRYCNNPPPQHGGKMCIGNQTYRQLCNQQVCPVDGGWSTWGEFDKCSRTCGGGTQRRIRHCNNPPPVGTGKQCDGSNVEHKSCNESPCPVDGQWSNWGAFGQCTRSCGGGVMRRERICNNPAPKHGGKKCSGSRVESKICNDQPCPVDGQWSKWSAFGQCTRPCGGGVMRRERVCNNPAPKYGGKKCSGGRIESKICNDQPCPVDGQWSSWGAFGQCTRSCGGGVMRRERICNNPAPKFGGKKCSGNRVESTNCYNQPCPIDGKWSKWGTFGPCTRSCGGGVMTRERVCNNPAPKHGGKQCSGSRRESTGCNVQTCNVDGHWSSWGQFTTCSKPCGGGVQERKRYCNNPPPQGNGKKCRGGNLYVRMCNRHKCPGNGEWGQWGAFGVCTKTCGTGFRRRLRFCNNPPPSKGGRYCIGGNEEVLPCNTQACPGTGSWSSWGSFSSCTTSCGGGIQRRYRKCLFGNSCIGSRTHIRICNRNKCSEDGQWGSWGAFGGCTRSCGGGIQRRFRYCDNPHPLGNGKPCSGGNTEVRPCNKNPCFGK